MDARPHGRPRALDAKKMRELLDLVGHGSSVEEAARMVGVSLRTIQREAKDNEFFDRDLQLALHSTSVDCERLMLQAARTHWRAAAWLLERSDPDRFAKRPPHSCSPETLWDVLAWVIEAALEATPAEHREAVFRRTHAAAERAFRVVAPDPRAARRQRMESFGARPTPLSDQEYLKTWRDPQNLRLVTDREEPTRPQVSAADADPGADALPAAIPGRAEAPGGASPDDPRGLLSPKMRFATKVPTTKGDAPQNPAPPDPPISRRDAETQGGGERNSFPKTAKET